jgi:hypothetical protein
MKKYLIVILVASFVSNKSLAQKFKDMKLNYSVSVERQLGGKGFYNNPPSLIGGSAATNLELDSVNTLLLLGHFNFGTFRLGTGPNDYLTFTNTGASIGYRRYLVKDLFLQTTVGYNKASIVSIFNTVLTTPNEQQSLVFTPAIGYYFKFKNGNRLGLHYNYNLFTKKGFKSNYGTMGLAYTFKRRDRNQ